MGPGPRHPRRISVALILGLVIGLGAGVLGADRWWRPRHAETLGQVAGLEAEQARQAAELASLRQELARTRQELDLERARRQRLEDAVGRGEGNRTERPAARRRR